MLVLLKKRYDYLCKAEFQKAEEIENMLTIVKNSKYDELIVPNTYYCTFMHGAGQQKALKLKHIDCDGHKVEIKQAKNPSDLLWLNRGISRRE